MAEALLVAIAIVVTAVALVLEHVGNVRISERHHSHHDTYVVPVSFTRLIVLTMAFMATLSLLLAWLCDIGVLHAGVALVLGFFDAFLVTSFVIWRFFCRYRISTFDDCMVVTPLVGPKVWVHYDRIDRLEWSGLRKESGFRNLVVWVDGRRVVTLLGIVDVDQVIMSIDRFDLLPQTA